MVMFLGMVALGRWWWWWWQQDTWRWREAERKMMGQRGGDNASPSPPQLPQNYTTSWEHITIGTIPCPFQRFHNRYLSFPVPLLSFIWLVFSLPHYHPAGFFIVFASDCDYSWQVSLLLSLSDIYVFKVKDRLASLDPWVVCGLGFFIFHVIIHVCPSVFICLSICLSVSIFIFLSTCLSVFLWVCVCLLFSSTASL